MHSQTTLTLGSLAPGARTRPEHPTPVPLSPWPVYCQQGEVAMLTSCTPPWMRLGVTYLRPRLAPPQPTFIRPAIPWLTIVAVAALAAVIAIAAAHLLSIAAEVHTVDSALAHHATELAPTARLTPKPRATVGSPPEAPPEVEPPPSPAPFPPVKPSQGQAPVGWPLELPPGDRLALPPPLERYYEEVRRAGRPAND